MRMGTATVMEMVTVMVTATVRANRAMAKARGMETGTDRLRLTMEMELGTVRMAKIPATERMAQEMERAPGTVAREEPTRIAAISLRFRERSWIRRIRRTRPTSPKTAHILEASA